MSGTTEVDIAACLRHSTTALVRRYAHLSPSHLQGVMEKVSAFGRPAAQGPILSGTVTGTGKGEEQKPIEVSQAVEKIGAGEGN